MLLYTIAFVDGPCCGDILTKYRENHPLPKVCFLRNDHKFAGHGYYRLTAIDVAPNRVMFEARWEDVSELVPVKDFADAATINNSEVDNVA